MFEEYRKLLRGTEYIVFNPDLLHYIHYHDADRGMVMISSEPTGEGKKYFDFYLAKVNKSLALALGYGLKSAYGNILNSFCLYHYDRSLFDVRKENRDI